MFLPKDDNEIDFLIQLRLQNLWKFKVFLGQHASCSLMTTFGQKWNMWEEIHSWVVAPLEHFSMLLFLLKS